MATLERAIEIAAKAHSGQLDKGGHPYILHPIRIMLNVTTPQEQITAVLHDVIEDTEITAEDLLREGFSEEVVQAIQALTKKKGESRLDAAKRTVLNPIARVVKIADVTDNMDISRIAHPNEKDMARLQEYKKVLTILQTKK